MNIIPFDRTRDEQTPQPWETCPITHLCGVGKPISTYPTDEWISRNAEMDRLIAAHGIPKECPNPG